MRLEQLRYFVEVAKTGSIRTAAEHLYITQPALGKAINSLEKELGYPLFKRSHTGMVLTDCGEMTREIVAEILAKADKLDFIKYLYHHTNVSDLQGKLAVTTITTISLELLQQVLPAFSIAYPNVELVVIERNSLPAVKDVISGKTDLALIGMEPSFFAQGISAADYVLESLWEEKLYALVKSSSDLAQKKSISLKQISQYPLALLAFDQEDDSVKMGLFAEYPHLKIAMRSSNFELTQRHILTTGSIGLAFIASVKDPTVTFLEDISVVPVSDKINVQFSIFYQKDHEKRQLIEAFVQTIKEIGQIPYLPA